MNHYNPLLLHLFKDKDLQIEVLRLRLHILEKGELSKKKREHFLVRFAEIRETINLHPKGIVKEDMLNLEAICSMLNSALREPNVRILLEDDETKNLYSVPRECQPINLFDSKRLGTATSKKENTFVPRGSNALNKESEDNDDNR